MERRRAVSVQFLHRGFVPTKDKTKAVGAIERYSLGGEGYFIQVGTIENPKWVNVNHDRFYDHVKEIESCTF